MEKRYYWLRLKDDFFNSKRIKKLRRLAGGDTYTIIYLKMQLMAMKTDGVLRWTGLEDSFADELALDLDERPDDVSVTLMYLLQVGLAETQDNKSFFFPWAVENTGSETASAQRVREHRAQKALQCNTDVTRVKRIGNVEKEIEKEIEQEKEKERASASDDDGFEPFWAAYPVKSGDIRQAYFEYVGALQSGATAEEIMAAVEWQSKEKDTRYMPSAEKWLRNRGWTEEKPKPREKDGGKKKQFIPAGEANYGQVDMDALRKVVDQI